MLDNELVQMADILPPTAPVSPSFDLWLYLLPLLAVLAVALFRYLRSSEQQLRRLRKRYQQHKIDNRQCAFQLNQLLRITTGTSSLSLSIPPQLENRQKLRQWQQYAGSLQAACYSRQGLDDDAMTQLLQETERWL